MSGFKNFILRGNLIELAVAFIMAVAFAAVIKATVDLLMGIIGKAGGYPNFNDWTPGGLLLGVWVTALVTFLITAAVVYYVIVVPYTAAKERYFPTPEPGTPDDIQLLQEIRDLLSQQSGGAHSAVTPPTA